MTPGRTTQHGRMARCADRLRSLINWRRHRRVTWRTHSRPSMLWPLMSKVSLRSCIATFPHFRPRWCRSWNSEGHELRRRVEVKTANGLAGCDDRENGVFALTLDPETGRENVLIYTSDQRRIQEDQEIKIEVNPNGDILGPVSIDIIIEE